MKSCPNCTSTNLWFERSNGCSGYRCKICGYWCYMVDAVEVKPPLGVKPKRIHDCQRLDELYAAFERYEVAEKGIPAEWIREMSDLMELHVDYYSNTWCKN